MALQGVQVVVLALLLSNPVLARRIQSKGSQPTPADASSAMSIAEEPDASSSFISTNTSDQPLLRSCKFSDTDTDACRLKCSCRDNGVEVQKWFIPFYKDEEKNPGHCQIDDPATGDAIVMAKWWLFNGLPVEEGMLGIYGMLGTQYEIAPQEQFPFHNGHLKEHCQALAKSKHMHCWAVTSEGKMFMSSKECYSDRMGGGRVPPVEVRYSEIENHFVLFEPDEGHDHGEVYSLEIDGDADGQTWLWTDGSEDRDSQLACGTKREAEQYCKEIDTVLTFDSDLSRGRSTPYPKGFQYGRAEGAAQAVQLQRHHRPLQCQKGK